MTTSTQSLIEAIQEGNIELTKELLSEQPILINCKNEQGVSILLLAAYYRNQAVINVLLENKSKLDIFEAAALGYKNSVERNLIEQPQLLNAFSADGFTPLGLACYFGHENIVHFLIEQKADVNIQSNNNFKVAPLHSAVASRQYKIAKLLLNSGAKVNAQQMSGVTPLHSAAHNGDPEMVELLLKFGAKKKARMKDGKTPLDFAMEDDFEAVIALLKN